MILKIRLKGGKVIILPDVEDFALLTEEQAEEENKNFSDCNQEN